MELEAWQYAALYGIGALTCSFLWGLLSTKVLGIKRAYSDGNAHPDFWVPAIFGAVFWPFALAVTLLIAFTKLAAKVANEIEADHD